MFFLRGLVVRERGLIPSFLSLPGRQVLVRSAPGRIPFTFNIHFLKTFSLTLNPTSHGILFRKIDWEDNGMV
jgi:hypothetical protein